MLLPLYENGNELPNLSSHPISITRREIEDLFFKSELSLGEASVESAP
jgi:hypothetical protein